MKKYPVQVILQRADNLGIILYRDGNEIHIEGPAEHLTDKLRQVIADNWHELLPVLPVTLCFTCLDEGRETPAFYEAAQIMYCEAHKPVVEACTVPDGQRSEQIGDGFQSSSQHQPELYTLSQGCLL